MRCYKTEGHMKERGERTTAVSYWIKTGQLDSIGSYLHTWLATAAQFHFPLN